MEPRDMHAAVVNLQRILFGICLTGPQLLGQNANPIQLLTLNQIQSIRSGKAKIEGIEGAWTGLVFQDGKWVARDVLISNSKISPSLRFTFLIRGISGLIGRTEMIRSGDGIARWYLEKGIGAPIEAGQPLRVNLGWCAYELYFSRYSNSTSIPPSSIDFIVSGIKQTVLCKRGVESASLIWAGDMDFDGKPDFLIHTSDDNAGWQETLYLSSNAKPGTVVGVASSQEYSPEM